METLAFTGTLETTVCCTCGMTYGVPEGFRERRKRDHETFYCPAGHPNYFPQKSDLQLAREERDRARAEAEQQKAEAERQARRAVSAEQSRRVTKGHLTRIRRRVAAGCCPWCNRTFQNLADHVKSKHHQHPGELD